MCFYSICLGKYTLNHVTNFPSTGSVSPIKNLSTECLFLRSGTVSKRINYFVNKSKLLLWTFKPHKTETIIYTYQWTRLCLNRLDFYKYLLSLKWTKPRIIISIFITFIFVFNIIIITASSAIATQATSSSSSSP